MSSVSSSLLSLVSPILSSSTPMAGPFSTLLVLFGVFLSSATVSLALGLEIELALNDSVSVNLTGLCPKDQPHVTFIANSEIIDDYVKKRQALTTRVNITDCCPAVAFAEVTVPGTPSNDELVISINILCGNNISTMVSSSWEISVQGITPAQDIQYNNGSLSWSDPYFHPDVPQSSFFTYTIIVNGVVIYYNITATSVRVNVSYCLMEFNVSIVTFLHKYQSTENITIQHNNYTVELVDTAYIPMERTIDANITFKVESDYQVCRFSYFIHIMFRNGTVRTYPTQSTPLPDKKEVIISEMVKLDLEIIMINVTFNVTKEVLTIPIDPSNVYGVTSSQAVKTHSSSFQGFPSTALSPSSSTSGKQSSETFLPSSSTGVPVSPTGSAENGNLVILVVVPCVIFIALITFTCICICCLIYRSRCSKKTNEVLNFVDDENHAVAEISTWNPNSMVFEHGGGGPEYTSELSMDVQGASSTNVIVDGSTIQAKQANVVSNPPLTDSDERSSKELDLEHPPPLPSSDHNKPSYATSTSSKIASTRSAEPMNNENSAIDVSIKASHN